MRFLALCAIVIVALIENGAGSDPSMSMCSGQYQVAFFEIPKNRSGAKEACKAYGGSLAHVKDDYIRTAINLTLGSRNSKKYHVSNDTRYSYGWSFYGSGYSNQGSKCTVVESGILESQTVSCNELHYYICEKEWKVNIVSNTYDSIVCEAVGCEEADTEWRVRNDGKTVPVSNEGGVFQRKSQGTAILDLQNSKVSDIKEYDCFAVNKDNTTKTNRSASSIIKVDAVPTVLNVTYFPCNSSVVLVWKPNPRAVGSEHRIRAQPKEQWEPVSSYTDDTNPKYSVLRDMKPNTSYKIRLAPVTSSYQEPAYLTANVSIRTGDMAALPTFLTMASFSKNRTCVYSWGWPQDIPKDAPIRNTIRVNSSLSSRRTDSSDTVLTFTDITRDNISYTINAVPNRVYTFEVHGYGCKKGMGYFWQSCTGGPEAPDAITPPKPLPSPKMDRTQAVTVYAPDEEKGLVSCVFLIIGARQPRKEKTSDYSIHDLIKLSYSTDDMEDYIAVAIENFTFSDEREVQFELGNGRITSCNIEKIGRIAAGRHAYGRDEKSVFLGQNRMLKAKTTYSAYIVATTPLSYLMSVSKSEEVSFTTDHLVDPYHYQGPKY